MYEQRLIYSFLNRGAKCNPTLVTTTSVILLPNKSIMTLMKSTKQKKIIIFMEDTAKSFNLSSKQDRKESAKISTLK